jgi:intergrase/recombinase
VKLNALASTDFFIEQNDTRGGVGANFLREWVAEKKVSVPIVESLMIGTAGTQAVSFLKYG